MYKNGARHIKTILAIKLLIELCIVKHVVIYCRGCISVFAFKDVDVSCASRINMIILSIST